jgi:hypothetical protein
MRIHTVQSREMRIIAGFASRTSESPGNTSAETNERLNGLIRSWPGAQAELGQLFCPWKDRRCTLRQSSSPGLRLLVAGYIPTNWGSLERCDNSFAARVRAGAEHFYSATLAESGSCTAIFRLRTFEIGPLALGDLIEEIEELGKADGSGVGALDEGFSGDAKRGDTESHGDAVIAA